MSITHSDIVKTEELVASLLKGMKISLKPEVSADIDGINVRLTGKDSAIMIGFHGENLADFTYLVNIMTRKQLDKDVHVRIDTADYMKNKDGRIKDMALGAIDKVRKSGFPEYLSGLNSYERRLVHSVVSAEGLVSESVGFGRDRKLAIKPRKEDE